MLKSSSYLSAVSSFTWSIAPFLVSFATFITYTVSGGTLDASKAFVAMSLFNLMQNPLLWLPTVIGEIVEAQVSVRRLLRFLLLPEINMANVTRTSANVGTGSSSEQQSFEYPPPTARF